MNMPRPKSWEAGYYGPPNPPVFTDIPNYTNRQGPVVGVVCNQCVAVVQRDQTDAHTQWHDNQRRMTVSAVKWCDAGDHTFKAGRPGSQSVMGTEIGEDGIEQSVQQDVCPECAQAARQKRVVRELETVKASDCPVCEKPALVYSKPAGCNVCMECGWDSNSSVQNIDAVSAYPKTTLNREYGKARLFMGDDRPEPA